MKDSFIKEQLLKLFEGKVLLVLDEDDLEPLILAAVPALMAEVEDLLEDPNFGNRLRANKLKRLATNLNSIPRLSTEQNIFHLTTEPN